MFSDYGVDCSPTYPLRYFLVTICTTLILIHLQPRFECSCLYYVLVQFFIFRCESGDLSGKHGRLRISSEGASRQTFAYIDPNIQLTGNTSSKVYMKFQTFFLCSSVYYHACMFTVIIDV